MVEILEEIHTACHEFSQTGEPANMCILARSLRLPFSLELLAVSGRMPSIQDESIIEIALCPVSKVYVRFLPDRQCQQRLALYRVTRLEP